MNKFATAMLIGTALVAAPASAQVIGPSPYLSQSDSPFNPALFSSYFYLEDVEDGLVNTPGLTVTGPDMCIAGTNCFLGSGLIDSVGNGGNGNVGNSIWAAGSLTITFDALVLGSLPTGAGLVWTDGVNPITFEAFDQNGVSLGQLVSNNADATFTGGTAEDRFFGAFNAGGISMLTINNPAGIEIDHVQYGCCFVPGVGNGVPEPSTWATMLLGFGAIGCALRRRRRVLQPAKATA